MSPAKGKNLLKSILKARLHLGCGCSDTSGHHTNRLTDVYNPIPKPKASPSSSSSSSGKTSTTTTTFSPHPYGSDDPNPIQSDDHKPVKKTLRMVMENPHPHRPPPNKIGDGIAVEKESEDPYEDFRESMMQMIMEKEIFTQEDLHHLLRRFLRLNSPAHRPLILGAFVDVCHSLVSDPPVYGG